MGQEKEIKLKKKKLKKKLERKTFASRAHGVRTSNYGTRKILIRNQFSSPVERVPAHWVEFTFTTEPPLKFKFMASDQNLARVSVSPPIRHLFIPKIEANRTQPTHNRVF